MVVTSLDATLSIPAALYAVTTKKYLDPLLGIGTVTAAVFPRSVVCV